MAKLAKYYPMTTFRPCRACRSMIFKVGSPSGTKSGAEVFDPRFSMKAFVARLSALAT